MSRPVHTPPPTPRRALLDRRRLMTGAAGFAAAMGAPIPFARHMPHGLIPIALAQTEADLAAAKDSLVTLNERPVNMETPPHLLDDAATPAERLFVRNNGLVPDVSGVTDESWRLVIDGEVDQPLDLAIADLKRDFETVTLRLPIECGGNGRKFYEPGARGNQWSFGAVGCPDWTGVRLSDILNRARLKPSAVYTGHYGADIHLSGDPEKHPISRGVPIEKALEPHTLVAFAMNGVDMPVLNGHPLRLIAPGWPGSCSQKWLTRIWLRDRVHDGAKMGGQSYRVPAFPVAPGTEVADEDMEIITSMPIKSLITAPRTGVRVDARAPLEARGHAWSGETAPARLDVSIDFGATWAQARLEAPRNKYAWRRWRAEIVFPQAGYYEIWARATDEAGRMQPATPPGWNPRGYLNNMQHRVAVFAV